MYQLGQDLVFHSACTTHVVKRECHPQRLAERRFSEKQAYQTGLDRNGCPGLRTALVARLCLRKVERDQSFVVDDDSSFVLLTLIIKTLLLV